MVRAKTSTDSKVTINAVVTKKDGRVVNLGKIVCSGPWYERLYWKVYSWYKRRLI